MGRVQMVLSAAFSDFRWGRDIVVATCIALVAGTIQVAGGLISRANRAVFWFSIVCPYVIVLGAQLHGA